MQSTLHPPTYEIQFVLQKKHKFDPKAASNALRIKTLFVCCLEELSRRAWRCAATFELAYLGCPSQDLSIIAEQSFGCTHPSNRFVVEWWRRQFMSYHCMPARLGSVGTRQAVHARGQAA
jgi:hypothetical protein